jgi:hypothetical protein
MPTLFGFYDMDVLPHTEASHAVEIALFILAFPVRIYIFSEACLLA